MNDIQTTLSPVDGSIYAERLYPDAAKIDEALDAAVATQAQWRQTPVSERVEICLRFVDAFIAKSAEIAPELSWQMRGPVQSTPAEIRGFEERARYMIDAAPEALADLDVGQKDGFTRFVRREPLDVVLVVLAWNSGARIRPTCAPMPI